MPYDSLTTEQKAAIQSVATQARALAGTLAHLTNQAKDVGLAYSGAVETALGTLQGSDLIPNTSGLAGAQDLTRDQLINLVGYYITIGATADNSSGSYNTNYHRAIYIAAAGINAVIGG